MKKILVLSTYDEIAEGHAYSYIKLFEKIGLRTMYIPMIREELPKHPYYFMDATGSDKLAYLRYLLLRLNFRLREIPFAPFREARNRYQGDFHVKTKEIISMIERVDFKPDYIFIGAYNYYLSPKTIFELHEHTKADIIMTMVDGKLLSGGCIYPLECDLFKDGCKNCPRFPYFKFIARNIYEQKEKYLSRIPLHLVCTEYDYLRAKNVSFLKDKSFHITVGCPRIPFVMTKVEARKKFGIGQDDFVILSGALNTGDRRKGFLELCQALDAFSKYKGPRRKTLLLLTKNAECIDLPSGLNVVAPGYLDLNGLFEAFYACDVFVSSSLDDSGPYMVNYSVACGRPVVSFPIGIALNLVRHKETGYIAQYKDITDFSNGIAYFYETSEEELLRVQQNCIETIEYYSERPWYDFLIK